MVCPLAKNNNTAWISVTFLFDTLLKCFQPWRLVDVLYLSISVWYWTKAKEWDAELNACLLQAFLNISWKEYKTKTAQASTATKVYRYLKSSEKDAPGEQDISWGTSRNSSTKRCSWPPRQGLVSISKPVPRPFHNDQLCDVCGCLLEGLSNAMQYTNGWRERIMNIRASLKLKVMQYPAIHTNYSWSNCPISN